MRKIINLSHAHYQNLPGKAQTSPQESEEERIFRCTCELRKICVAHMVASSNHRCDSSRSWAFALTQLHKRVESAASLAHRFHVPRQKIYSSKKAFAKLASRHHALSRNINEETVTEFVATNLSKADFDDALAVFCVDVSEVLHVLVYAPQSRRDEREVAIDMFTPSIHRRPLLAKHKCNAISADNVAEFINFIKNKGA